MTCQVLVVVYKQGGAPTRVLHLESCIGVALYASLAISIQVQVYPVSLGHLWLAVFNVYLSGHCLVTLLYAGNTLAYLYGLHPWPWYISKSIRCCYGAEVGDVFCEHLHISAAESQ